MAKVTKKPKKSGKTVRDPEEDMNEMMMKKKMTGKRGKSSSGRSC